VGNKKGKWRAVISLNATPRPCFTHDAGANTLSLQISVRASAKIEDLGRRRRRIISLRNINFVGINHDQFERLFRVNHRHDSVLKFATPSIAFVSAIGPQIESVEMHSIDGFALRGVLFLCISLTSDVVGSKKLSALC
jgi:hypothetical protein